MSSINFNLATQQTQRMLIQNSQLLDRSMMRLATGLRINSGRDDPAGLIASETLRSRLATLDAETRALERNDSVVRVAEGALQEMDDLLVEAEALAVASANTGGMSEAEIEANQMMLDSIVTSIDRIASTTTFAGEKLLDGNVDIPMGDDTFSIDRVDSAVLGEMDIDGETLSLADVVAGGAADLINGSPEDTQALIGAARDQVSTLRGELGAFSANFIEPARAANQIAFENISAAESAIRDASIAQEVSNAVRAQTLFNTGLQLIGVSPINSQNALKLVGGSAGFLF